MFLVLSYLYFSYKVKYIVTWYLRIIYKINYIIIGQSHHLSNHFKILHKYSTCFHQGPLVSIG